MRLTDAIVRRLPPPSRGNRIYYDQDVGGFGCRVTSGGARSFVLTYRTRARRQRRYTIGAFPDWTTASARDQARRLKQMIDRGGDPLAELEAERGAPTVADLCDRVEAEHLPRKRPRTRREYCRQIARYIRPAIGRLKVTDVTWSDIDALHQRITRSGGPYEANRTLALLSKMFALAVLWRLRTDNPCKGVERNVEQARKRYLTAAELARLLAALAATRDQQAADIVLLLLLTGARRGEVLAARWADFDLRSAIWTKPASTTKQKAEHIAPLSAPAIELLTELRRRSNSPVWVFPADSAVGHRVSLERSWEAICKAAEISNLRVHDLRHSFASQLASNGASLPMIGALLGHSNPSTTHRYAHLFDDPIRQATERVGAIITRAGRHG
jgi:integrase